MKYILGLALVVTALFALPSNADGDQKRLAVQNPNLIEGDILGVDQYNKKAPVKRWPDGKIPYVIHNNLEIYKSRIVEAMDHFHNNTCIKFVPRTSEKNYVSIFNGNGCFASVGMLDVGRHLVSLGFGCRRRGTMLHSLGHVIGFYDEQNRPDRDEYLTINWDNIIPELKSQFELSKHQANELTPFDYDSIMMLGNYDFSKGENMKSMEAKNGKVLKSPYDKNALTDSDIERVKKLYNC